MLPYMLCEQLLKQQQDNTSHDNLNCMGTRKVFSKHEYNINFPPFFSRKVEKALKLRAEIAEKEAEIYRDSQAKLEQVREEQQECLTSHVEMTTAWSAREKQRLNADRQRLERVKDHLRLDKEHMETENEELSKEILQQTEEFQTRKEELVQGRGLLQVKTN